MFSTCGCCSSEVFAALNGTKSSENCPGVSSSSSFFSSSLGFSSSSSVVSILRMPLLICASLSLSFLDSSSLALSAPLGSEMLRLLSSSSSPSDSGVSLRSTNVL